MPEVQSLECQPWLWTTLASLDQPAGASYELDMPLVAMLKASPSAWPSASSSSAQALNTTFLLATLRPELADTDGRAAGAGAQGNQQAFPV